VQIVDLTKEADNLNPTKVNLLEASCPKRINSPKHCKPEIPKDCNCGRPEIKVDGEHICRYYGQFECYGCHKRWSSAYTWKGEMQACRACNKESLPWKTELLKRAETSSIAGPHDCERCGMCQKLGKDCSMIMFDSSCSITSTNKKRKLC